MNRKPVKHEVDNSITPRCLEHFSVDDAFYNASCIASFLQLASRGIAERVANDGKPGILEDALYGMETCFDLLQDMLEIAEKESMPAETAKEALS